MNRLFFVMFFILSSFVVNAQYEVQITYQNQVDSVVYFRLCTFDEKLYLSKDTIRFSKGKAKIVEPKSIFGGIYYLYFPISKKRIYLSLDDSDRFSLSLNGKHLLDSAICTSEKNKVFIQYQIKENEFAFLDSQYQALVRTGKATLKGRETLFLEKAKTLSEIRKNALVRLNKQSSLYLYFNTLNQIDEYSPSKKNYLARDVFIEKFALRSPKLYFSPALKPILYEYLSSYPLIADSVMSAIDVVMRKVDCKSKSYVNVFNYFANILQNSSIQQNTKGYINFIDTYLLQSTCKPFSKAKQTEYLEIYTQYELLNKVELITDIQLKDSSGVFQSLSSFSKMYTYSVICFYDPECQHCEALIPELHGIVKRVNEIKNFKVGIFAICNTDESKRSDWLKFITHHGLSDNYMHVILGNEKKVRESYLAYSNPMFYLIDQQGQFIMKKTNIGAINRFLLRGN